MNKSKNGLQRILPVFFSFMVMGFVDIIGVATGYVKQDFELTNFVAQFLPMMVLLWFFVLSVPAGVLQDKVGKRNMLNAGMIIQAIGLGLPFLYYSFGMMLVSFILLGVGNTIIQVSANPLLQDVSPPEKLASYMSTSQFFLPMFMRYSTTGKGMCLPFLLLKELITKWIILLEPTFLFTKISLCRLHSWLSLRNMIFWAVTRMTARAGYYMWRIIIYRPVKNSGHGEMVISAVPGTVTLPTKMVRTLN